MRGSRSALVVALLGAAPACGSNRPELPPDLGEPEPCVAVGYPDGPYGHEPGSIAENACFEGWSAPDRVAHQESTLAPIALSDFFDPAGDGSTRLLLVNTAALWCSACRIEHESLPNRLSTLGPRGLSIVSALFEDTERRPADLDDLRIWVETFGTNFPMVLDPGYSFGVYARAETAPLNLLIDPRRMTIQRTFIGDQAAVMWPYIEGELQRLKSE